MWRSGELNARRKKFVQMAFNVLDVDGSGDITIQGARVRPRSPRLMGLTPASPACACCRAQRQPCVWRRQPVVVVVVGVGCRVRLGADPHATPQWRQAPFPSARVGACPARTTAWWRGEGLRLVSGSC